ncbi:hypothetical protein P8T65_42140 [Streptomyces sp. 11x1]|nr:hypothetical protein [Streptomyces sp. 11x1]WNZ14781.1 hypothetical protein P8T65_42140 [Streptomyces sp. 11x1]
MLTRLPRVHPDRRAVVVAGMTGAAGLELLKWLLTGQGVAAKSMYSAFAVPVAIVLWINLMARLLYCAFGQRQQRGRWCGPARQPRASARSPGSAPQPTAHHSGRQPAAAHQQHRVSRRTARDPSVVRARPAVCGHRLGDGVRPPGRGGVRSRR